jgi:hypothetical protein
MQAGDEECKRDAATTENAQTITTCSRAPNQTVKALPLFVAANREVPQPR